MMKIILCFICLFFLCISSIFAEQTALTIVTLEDSPLSFSVENEETDGLSVELVKEIQKRLNQSQKITILPWTRGYKMATTMKNVMLFGTVRTKERENLFKWVGPIVMTKLVFYAKKDSGIKINTLDDAKKVARIATTKEFFSEQILGKAGFKNLERSSKPEDGLKKLCRCRVDLWPALNVTLYPLF